MGDDTHEEDETYDDDLDAADALMGRGTMACLTGPHYGKIIQVCLLPAECHTRRLRERVRARTRDGE